MQVIGGAAPAALAAPTNGLALMALIYAFGSTSGAHLSEWAHLCSCVVAVIRQPPPSRAHTELTAYPLPSPMLHADPAVSLMLLLRGKIGSGKAIAYMVAQVAGAVLGAFICTAIIPGVAAGSGLGAPGEEVQAGGLHAAPLCTC